MHRRTRLPFMVGAFVVGVSLAACSRRPVLAPVASVRPAVPETGVVIDLVERNNQVIAAKPGDVIMLPLIGQANSRFQWSFRAPVSGGYMTMKRHTVTTVDPRLKAGEVLSEWVFKIERAATFTLRLEYHDPLATRRAPVRVFTVKIAADRALEALPPLFVDEPVPRLAAPGTLRLAGYVRTSVGAVRYTLENDAGAVVATGSIPVTAAEDTAFSSFEKTLWFSLPRTPNGVVALTPETDGALDAINAISVPVVFHPDLMTVQVYFGSHRLDPEATCVKVFPVPRYLPKSTSAGQAALEALFAGPTPAERRGGYFSSLPAGVRLKTLEISDGVARADFSPALERGVGGSCRVAAIRAQLTQTLRQFSTVSEVILAVDGRTADILQP